MEYGRIHKIQMAKYCFVFLLVLLSLTLSTGGTAVVNITLVDTAVEKGAVCLDGSPPGYHLVRGHGSGANKWLVFLEGGGWCSDLDSCQKFTFEHRGSSKHMSMVNFTGILAVSLEENPDFYNWNVAFIRYCDGASFAGEGYDEASHLFFRGQRIWSVVIEELMSKGMRHADQALLAGCSAGGLAAILHCDEFRDLFPKTTIVKCLSDGGFFFDVVDIAGIHFVREMFNQIVDFQGVEKNLPWPCTSQMSTTSCFFANNLLVHTKTPVFIVNAAYDVWQITNAVAPFKDDPNKDWKACRLNYEHCNGTHFHVLEGFRAHMISAVSDFSKSSKNGIFINSCFTHCQTNYKETWYTDSSPQLENKRIAEAVGDWYFDREDFKEIDCPFPCDRTCRNMAFGP